MRTVNLLRIAFLMVVLVPSFSIAADVAQTQQPFQIQTTGSTTILIVIVQNSKNSRFLGDVQININNKTYTTPDPPPPGGYQIPDLNPGQIEIVAQRKGYQVYDKTQSLQKNKFNQLSIQLNPQAGTPTVNQSSLLQNSTSLFGTSQWPTNYQSSTFLGNNLPSVINPFLNSFGTTNTTNYGLNQYPNTNTSLFGGLSQGLLTNQNLGLTNFTAQYLDSLTIRNYSLLRNSPTGEIYFVNNQNAQDARKITFVDRGDGQGGLAFIPAGSTFDVSYNPQNESRWYVALYRTGTDGTISLQGDKLSAVNFTPQDYANTVSGVIVTTVNPQR